MTQTIESDAPIDGFAMLEIGREYLLWLTEVDVTWKRLRENVWPLELGEYYFCRDVDHLRQAFATWEAGWCEDDDVAEVVSARLIAIVEVKINEGDDRSVVTEAVTRAMAANPGAAVSVEIFAAAFVPDATPSDAALHRDQEAVISETWETLTELMEDERVCEPEEYDGTGHVDLHFWVDIRPRRFEKRFVEVNPII